MRLFYRQRIKKTKTPVKQQYQCYNQVDTALQETAQSVAQYYAEMDVASSDHIPTRSRFLSTAHAKRQMVLRRAIQDMDKGRFAKKNKWLWQFAAAVIVLTLMLFPVQGQMSVAAKDSLPGDALYLVKLAAESSAVEYIEESEVKALLTLSFADKRVGEIVALAQEGREIPLSAIYRAHRLINTALGFTAWAAEDDMEAVLDEINQHIQSYVHMLEEAKAGSLDLNNARLSDMQGRCLRLQLIVTAASLEPGVFMDAYRAGTPEQMTALSAPLGSTPTVDK